jgi:hypothetical protein
VGAVDEETIRRYIETQQWDDPGENFKDHRAHRALKPALSRTAFRRLQPQTGDFQSQSKPGSQPVVI